MIERDTRDKQPGNVRMARLACKPQARLTPGAFFKILFHELLEYIVDK
jgi:hypothetical protein